MKKLLWQCLGFLSLGMAYIGIITPGLPYSPFVVFAAYCFAKSSPKMHAWIMNHKTFWPIYYKLESKACVSAQVKVLHAGLNEPKSNTHVFGRSSYARHYLHSYLYGPSCYMGLAFSQHTRRVRATHC